MKKKTIAEAGVGSVKITQEKAKAKGREYSYYRLTYPQCPMTLFLQMGDAFMARDIAKGQKIYTILMTEYPDFEGMRAAYKSNYEGFMRIANSGPR